MRYSKSKQEHIITMKIARHFGAIYTPTYDRPKWWQFQQRSYIRWMKRNRIPFKLRDKS